MTASAYPSPRQVLYVCVGAFLLAQLVVFPLLAARSARLGLVGAEVAVLAVAVLFIQRRRMVLEDLLLLNATPLRCLALAVPVAAAAGLLVEQFDQWSIAVLDGLGVAMPLGLQRDVIELQVVRGLSELGLTLVATALVPAVCEEAFFRGLAFTGLCAHRGPAIAVVGSAALFAATHFSPWHLPALFLLGLLLAALTYWTHSVYPAVVAHLTNNLLAVGEVNLEAYSGVDLLGNGIRWGVLALAAAVLVVGLALVRRQKPIMPLPVWASARPDPLSNDAPG